MKSRIVHICLSGLIVLIALLMAMPISAEQPLDQTTQKVFSLGLRPSSSLDAPRADIDQRASLRALPPSIDLSEYLPPVGFQGEQGSCAGWSVGYYYKTWQEQVERDWGTSDTSHQFSPAYIYNQRATSNCNADEGMTLGNAFAIVNTMGIASLAVFPYNVSDTCTQPTTQVISDSWEYRSDSYGFLFLGNQGGANPPDIDTLKGLLAENKPFVIGVPIYSDFYGTGANFTVDEPTPSDTLSGGHALFVVGYDDAIGGFKVVNSWGTSWGDGGFGYLSYAFVQNWAWEAWIMDDHMGEDPTVSVELAAGWNQVILPANMAAQTACDLFAPIVDDLDKVWMLDENIGRWLRFAPCLPSYANTLNQVGANEEIWVSVTQGCTWDIAVIE